MSAMQDYYETAGGTMPNAPSSFQGSSNSGYSPAATNNNAGSGSWNSILGAVGSFVGGYTAGSRNSAQDRQRQLATAQSNNWLWLGIAALGAVLLFLVIKK